MRIPATCTQAAWLQFVCKPGARGVENNRRSCSCAPWTFRLAVVRATASASRSSSPGAVQLVRAGAAAPTGAAATTCRLATWAMEEGTAQGTARRCGLGCLSRRRLGCAQGSRRRSCRAWLRECLPRGPRGVQVSACRSVETWRTERRCGSERLCARYEGGRAGDSGGSPSRQALGPAPRHDGHGGGGRSRCAVERAARPRTGGAEEPARVRRWRAS